MAASQANPTINELISELQSLDLVGIDWRKSQIIGDIVKTGTLEDVNKLVNEGANVTDVNVLTEVLVAAAQVKRRDVMCLAFDKGADVNAANSWDIEALTSVLYREHGSSNNECAELTPKEKECLDLLLSKGADVNKRNKDSMTALMHVISYKNVVGMELLIKLGADVNIKNCIGRTALTIAATDGHLGCLKLLIQSGAKLNDPLAKFSPLDEAIMNGRKQCAVELINAGADVNLKRDLCPPPLINACYSGFFKLIRLLLEAGADVNIVNDRGISALMSAAKMGYYTCCELLIQAGADVNHQDVNGNTVLMRAVVCNITRRIKHRFNIVRLLLNKGACVNKTNASGHNVLKAHVVTSDPPDRELLMLIMAAGETMDCTKLLRKANPRDRRSRDTDVDVPEYLLAERLNLKHLCREAIRKHLVHLVPHQHLFGRIPKLGLPGSITGYLLFNMSLEMEWKGVDDNGGDNADDDDEDGEKYGDPYDDE